MILIQLYRLWARRRRGGERTVSAAARGPLALLVHQARYDVLATLRNPRARFFTYLFPILMLVIFAGVFGKGTTVVDGVRVPTATFFVAGILTMSVITAAYGGIAMSVATARETGVLKRRRATPVPGWALVGGQALAALATTLVMSALLLAIARLGYGVSLSAGALAATFIAVAFGTLAFSCLGFAVAGLIGNPDAAQPVVQLTMMPLYFISGVWIPTERLSPGLRSVASVFPIEHLASAAHLASVKASFADAFAPGQIAILALWALAAAAFAARRFSWLPAAATG